MKIARPTITASTYTAMALTSDHPNCATAPATSAKMPTGATSSTHRTMRISAWVATSASWVRTSRLSSGSAAAALPDDKRLVLTRSEEHTSELQSRSDLVCRLLLEKKKKTHTIR